MVTVFEAQADVVTGLVLVEVLAFEVVVDCLIALVLDVLTVVLVMSVLDCLLEVDEVDNLVELDELEGATLLQPGFLVLASSSVYVTGTQPGSWGSQPETCKRGGG